MRIKLMLSALALCALFSVSALAQVGRLEGDVKSSSGEPVVGAEIQIVRTDIKGSYAVKTDKKGHYLHAGLPYVGTYTLLVSAPGFAPTSITGVKLSTNEPINFTLVAGDGRKMTIEEVGSQPKPGAGQKQMSEAEIKKAQEEYDKKKKEIDDYKGKFEEMKQHFDAGQALLAKNEYAGAAAEFKQAVALDPDQNQHVITGNLAIALYNSAVTRINGGQRDEAKADFTDSAAAADKAITQIKAQMTDPTKSNDPAMKKNLAAYTKSKADSSFILATKYGDAAAAETAAAAYKDAAGLTDDPTQKKNMLVKSAKTYFESGNTEKAIEAYQGILQTDPDNIDALYGMGLAYAGAGKFQESANTLQQFLDKAPADHPNVEEVKAVIKDLVTGNNLEPPKSDKSRNTRRKKP